MNEQRANTRNRTLKAAKIALDHGGSIDCLVRNLSVSGACLEVVSPIGIPVAFTLVLDDSSINRPCHVVWRTHRRIGVTFDF